MIRHVVMWKLRESAEGQDRLANMDLMKRELESLPAKMPGVIRSLKVGLNFLENGTNFDLVLIADFESRQALDTYLAHPEHLKVADLVMRVREQRAAVDFEA